MSRHSTLSAILCALLSASATLLHSQEVRTARVEFPRGQSGTTVNGTITGYEVFDYLLRAKGGQQMTAELKTDHGATSFNIFAPGTKPGEDTAMYIGETSGNRFEGALPADGEYRIRVGMMRSAARRNETAGYSLAIAIGRSAAAASAARSGGYDLGRTKGYQDGAGGLSRTPDRHAAEYSEADRADFFRGYEDGYNQGIKPGARPPASFGQPLTAVNGQGTVTIMEGDRTVAVCRTASPNIEQTRFISEQQQIVVKSRGNHGPATVQLFDSRKGTELGKVMAYAIQDGQPPWAQGMGD